MNFSASFTPPPKEVGPAATGSVLPCRRGGDEGHGGAEWSGPQEGPAEIPGAAQPAENQSGKQQHTWEETPLTSTSFHAVVMDDNRGSQTEQADKQHFF